MKGLNFSLHRGIRSFTGQLSCLTVLVLGLGLSSTVHANCIRKKFVSMVEDTRSAGFPFGKVDLASSYLQPVGTPLGSATVAAAAARGLTPETVLWECDQSDANSLYEMFATNGDDRVGGFWEIGNGSGTSNNDGLPGYYATWFPYVGIKITHLNSGMVLTRYWQQAKLTRYDEVGTKIQIKAKHLSMLHAELARVSSLPPAGGSGSNFCGDMASLKINARYNCAQPNAYIQLRGPGITSDEVGSDSNTHYVFHGAGNGVAFGMYRSATLRQRESCVVRSVTPVVSFTPITVRELNEGTSRSNDFTIELECVDRVKSGTSLTKVALGIKVLSANAYAQAQALGLVTRKGGVRYLLSDNYGLDPAVATGVGISLRNMGNGEQMNFLGTEATGGGASAGWYPVLSGASDSGEERSGYHKYTQTISATLSALPGQEAKAGMVNATASVIVKIQ